MTKIVSMPNSTIIWKISSVNNLKKLIPNYTISSKQKINRCMEIKSILTAKLNMLIKQLIKPTNARPFLITNFEVWRDKPPPPSQTPPIPWPPPPPPSSSLCPPWGVRRSVVECVSYVYKSWPLYLKLKDNYVMWIIGLFGWSKKVQLILPSI